MRVGVFACVVALLVAASCEQSARVDVAKDVIGPEPIPETGTEGDVTEPDQHSPPAVDGSAPPVPAATDERLRESGGMQMGDHSGAPAQQSYEALDEIARADAEQHHLEHEHNAGRQPLREAEGSGATTVNAGSGDSAASSGHNAPHEDQYGSNTGEPSPRDATIASGSEESANRIEAAAEQQAANSRGGAEADGTAVAAGEVAAAAADDAANAALEPERHRGQEQGEHDAHDAAQAHRQADDATTDLAAGGPAVPASRTFLCRVCGSTVFHAADHLRDLRLPTDAQLAAAAGGLPAHPEPAAPAPRYVQAASRAEAALGPRGALLEVEGHPAFRGTPGHVYEADRQRGSQASSGTSSASSGDGSGSGNSETDGGSLPGASGQHPPHKQPQGRRRPQSTPRPPFFLAAAFDSGIGITLGAAESREGLAVHAPPPPLPGYSARSVHCGRCGAMLGHLVVQRTASSRRTAGDDAPASAAAGVGVGGAAAGLQQAGATSFSSSGEGSEGAAAGEAAQPQASESAAQPTGPPPPPIAALAPGEAAAGDGAGTTHESTAGSESGGAAGAAAHAAAVLSAAGVTVRPYVAGEEAAALRHLRGACLRFGSGGWWQYEWCVGRHVRQFHADPATGKADPDWSLGTYDPSAQADRIVPPPQPTALAPGGVGSPEAAAAAAADGPRLYYSSQFYRGGQRCDENGKRRATEVQLYCCPRHRDKGALIASISEPSLCRYALAVCIPELCVDSPAPGVTPVVRVGRPPQLQAQEAPLAQGPIVVVKPAAPLGDGGGSMPVQVASAGEVSRAAAAADRADAEAPTAGQPEALKGLQRPQRNRAPGIDLPESFILAFWRALLGDSSADFASLLSGEPATASAPSPKRSWIRLFLTSRVAPTAEPACLRFGASAESPRRRHAEL